MKTTTDAAYAAAEKISETAEGMRAVASVLDVLASTRHSPPSVWVRMEADPDAGKPAKIRYVVELHPVPLHPYGTANTMNMLAAAAAQLCTSGSFRARDVIGTEGRHVGRAHTVVEMDVDIDGTPVRLRGRLFTDEARAEARRIWGTEAGA